jgi:cytochrome c oxidase subunit 2
VNGGGSSPVREARAPVGQMLGIGAIASALGIALALIIDWFPVAASKEAHQIDTLWDVLLIVSVPIFVLVVTVVLYSAVRFRMRPGEELADGPPIHGNTRLEVIWTALPAIILVALCSYAYVVLTNIEEAKADSMNVRVVGEQFTWTFYYKDSNGKEVASNQLYVPKDRPVLFAVQSKDVLHDFWVPAFRLKIDAVRGITTHYRVTPNRLGTYAVVCAELCGLGHAAMRQNAHVVTQQAFDQWLSKRASGATASAGGAPAPGDNGAGGGAAPDGKAIFTGAANCKTCHTLADAGATGTVGPNLDKAVPKLSKAFIKESIVNPDAHVTAGYSPGIMPSNFADTLGDSGVNAVVNYLKAVAKP